MPVRHKWMAYLKLHFDILISLLRFFNFAHSALMRFRCSIFRLDPSSKAILSALLNAEKLDVGPNLTSFKDVFIDFHRFRTALCFHLSQDSS